MEEYYLSPVIVFLAVEELWAFYSGLGLIILGVGLLKPNISTMVGGCI